MQSKRPRCLTSHQNKTEANYSKAILADPNSADAMVLRSIVLLLTAKLSEALEQVVSALRLDPDNSRAKSLRLRLKTIIRQKDDGNTFFRENRWQEAIEQYSDALKACDVFVNF